MGWVVSNLQELVAQLAAVECYIADQELALKPAKEAAKNLRTAVLALMNEIGTDSAKTPDGHRVVVSTTTIARIVDGDDFMAFVEDEGGLEFVQKRANLEAVMAYLNEHNEPPPGVSVETVNTLRFNRSKQ